MSLWTRVLLDCIGHLSLGWQSGERRIRSQEPRLSCHFVYGFRSQSYILLCRLLGRVDRPLGNADVVFYVALLHTLCTRHGRNWTTCAQPFNLYTIFRTRCVSSCRRSSPHPVHFRIPNYLWRSLPPLQQDGELPLYLFTHFSIDLLLTLMPRTAYRCIRRITDTCYHTVFQLCASCDSPCIS